MVRVLVVLASAIPAPAAAPVRVLVDDTPLALSPPPTLVGGTVYLPLRPLARHFAVGIAVTSHGAVSVTRADGPVLTLRPDRMGAGSWELAWGVLNVPVR